MAISFLGAMVFLGWILESLPRVYILVVLLIDGGLIFLILGVLMIVMESVDGGVTGYL